MALKAQNNERARVSPFGLSDIKDTLLRRELKLSRALALFNDARKIKKQPRYKKQRKMKRPIVSDITYDI